MGKKIELPTLPRGEGSMSFHSMGGIIYRKNVKDKNGKKHQMTVYGETPKDCMKKMRLKESEINKIIYQKNNQTLTEAMLQWCEVVHKPTVKPQTNDRLRKTIINQIGSSDIGNINYSNISSEQLQDIITNLNTNNYSYSVIKKTYDALRAFYNYISLKEKTDNPMNFVVLPKYSNVKSETKVVKWFEKEDIDKFIDACGLRWNTGGLRFKYGYALAANIYLGLRAGELLALQWKDIDWDKKTISVWKTVVEVNNDEYDRDNPENNSADTKKVKFIVQESTKTEHRRIVPINNRAMELLQLYKDNAQYTDPDDYVISTSNRRTNTTKNISDMIRDIEKAGNTTIQEYNTHILRHTCASLYFRKGVPVEIIAKILGNSREVCEKTYVHLAEEQLKNAASLINSELLN